MRQRKCSNKKTVFLIRNVASNCFGGGEIYQLKLADKMKKTGFDPVIVTNSQKLIELAKSSGFNVLVPPYIKRQNWSGWRNILLPIYFFNILKLKRWYKKEFLQFNPGIINIQSRDDFLAATLAAKRGKQKIIWTDHADFKNWVLKNVNVRFKNIIGKKIIKYSKYVDKVIFVSENVKKETEDMIWPLRINNSIVIENGVNDEYNKFDGIKRKKQSFIFLGRVTEDKGIRELLLAFNKVNKKYKKAVLDIYGDGDFAKFANLIENRNNVIFHGSTDAPLESLAKSEIFVLPSHMEGLSLALIEAAMMKKVIIATRVGGNGEVIIDGENGILVPVEDKNVLAEAMLEVLSNPGLANKFANKARLRYEAKYDLDKIFTEKILPLYVLEDSE